MEAARAHIVLPPPKGGPLQEVFAEAILEETSVHQRRSPLDWIASFLVHIAILGVLLVLPLYFTSGLDIQNFNLTFLAPPMTPAAPPPPPMASSASARPVHSAPVHTFVPGKLTAPTFIPRTIAKSQNDGSGLEEEGSPVAYRAAFPEGSWVECWEEFSAAP